MGLAFYDDGQTLFAGNPLRTFHDGHLGSSQDKLIYLRNNDVAKYYTNITVHHTINTYEDLGPCGTTGWGTKFMYGQRRPTEAEWDEVRSGDPISIPDIGSTSIADTFTYHPIWIRVTCPGNESAQARDNQAIQVFFLEQNVGA